MEFKYGALVNVPLVDDPRNPGMKRSGKKIYHVPDSLVGQTIAAVLKHWQSDISWNDARKLLTQRRVSINGTICVDVGRRIKQGDVVHLLEHSRTPIPTAADIEILHMDPHVVVAVKPALMTTLRHAEERSWKSKRKNLQPTMDESLPLAMTKRDSKNSLKPNSRDRTKSKRRGPAFHVRPVHRLDRDTSGVMVFARTPNAETELIKQFKRHSIDRVYHAIVHGHPDDQTIESQFVRDRGDGLRGSSTDPNAESERAVTHIKKLKNLGPYSLIECRLETGRTHQIRIHLSEKGHLVCGDTMYHRRPDGSHIADRSGAPRLALHAYELAFDHPVYNERMKFHVPLPADLARFVARLSKPEPS